MISSQTRHANHPSRVLVRHASVEGIQSGILTDFMIMTDNLATIFDAAIDRRIGALPMDRIDGALRHTLGLA